MQILESAFNEGVQATLAEFVRQWQPTFPVGWNDRMAAMGYLQIPIMMPGYVPKMVFIDRTGIIRAQYKGEDDFFREPEKTIRAKLDEMLAVRKKAVGGKGSGGKASR